MNDYHKPTAAETLALRQQQALAIDEEGQGFVALDHIRETAEPLVPIWGNYLFRKAITMIVGDPGIMKTTMGYALAMALCRGDTFLGKHADYEAKVLYLDFESSQPLIKQRADLIDPDWEKTPNLNVWSRNEYALPEIAPAIIKHAQDEGFNIIIIDNNTTAFNTFDENDNAEAGKQIQMIRKIVDEADAAAILFHHPSKMLSAVLDPTVPMPSLNKGSGAGARARLVDLLFNLNRTHVKDLIQFECCKDRIMGNQNQVQYITRRLVTDGDKTKATFTLMDELPPGVALDFTPTDLPKEKVKKEILQLLLACDSMNRNDIVQNVRKDGTSPSTIDKALNELRRGGRVIPNYSGKYGYYASRSRIQIQERRKEEQARRNKLHNEEAHEDLSD